MPNEENNVVMTFEDFLSKALADNRDRILLVEVGSQEYERLIRERDLLMRLWIENNRDKNEAVKNEAEIEISRRRIEIEEAKIEIDTSRLNEEKEINTQKIEIEKAKIELDTRKLDFEEAHTKESASEKILRFGRSILDGITKFAQVSGPIAFAVGIFRIANKEGYLTADGMKSLSWLEKVLTKNS